MLPAASTHSRNCSWFSPRTSAPGIPKPALALSQGSRDSQKQPWPCPRALGIPQTSPDLVPGHQEFPNSPGLVPGQQRFPKTNPDLVPGHQEFPQTVLTLSQGTRNSQTALALSQGSRAEPWGRRSPHCWVDTDGCRSLAVLIKAGIARADISSRMMNSLSDSCSFLIPNFSPA